MKTECAGHWMSSGGRAVSLSFWESFPKLVLVAKRTTAMSPLGIPPATDLADGPEPPNLSDYFTRTRLTPAAVDGMVRLAEIWRLTGSETCALLGGVSKRTWSRMKKRQWSGTLSQDTLTRISALLGIFKGLRLLFSEPLSDEWVRLLNNGPLFEGHSPLDTMIQGGIAKMLDVRRYIDGLCSSS
jgi:hypothetical protein